MSTEVVHVDELTDLEALVLLQAERTIERGLKTFVEVGRALARIRDGRLYRTDYPTFEAYCHERWALSRPRAYELMSAASVVSAIADTGIRPPANEAQARELSRLRDDPEALRAAWSEAHERGNGRPTAATVREVVREHITPSTPDTTNVPAGREETPAQGPSSPDAGLSGRPGADASTVDAGGTPGGAVTRDADGPATRQAAQRIINERIAAGQLIRLDGGNVIDAENYDPAIHVRAEESPTPTAKWDPEERRQHEEQVRRKRDIDAARRHAASIVATVQSAVATIVIGSRYGEPGLVTREMVADLRSAIDLLEKEIGDEG